MLKLSAEEFDRLRRSLPIRTSRQKDTVKLFTLSVEDREILEELREVLEEFESVTNDLQTNQVSISRVYPAVRTLMHKLSTNLWRYTHTEKLRKELLKSLMSEKRFGKIIDDDIFTVSTFLDPTLGISFLQDCFFIIV